MAQFFLKDVILYICRSLKGICKDPVFDAKLPFLCKASLNPARRRIKSGRTDLVIIEHTGDWRPPVKDQKFISMAERKTSDIICFRL